MNVSTNFAGTENPLRETGSLNWLDGLAEGLDWQNIQKTPGFAHASSLAVSAADDCTAVVGGSWTWNQTVRATAVANDTSRGQEIELRLNTTITAHSIIGYEIDIFGGGCIIVRWDGARGVGSILTGTFTLPGARSFATGDKFMASNNQGLISIWDDIGAGYVFVGNFFDSTYQGGSPGLGSYLSNPSDALTDVGWSDFNAFDAPLTSRIVGTQRQMVGYTMVPA